MKHFVNPYRKIINKALPHLTVLILIAVILVFSRATDDRKNYRQLILNDLINSQSFSDFEDNLFQYEVTTDSVTTSFTLHNADKTKPAQLSPLLTDFSFKKYNNNYKKGKSKKTIAELSNKLRSFNVNELSQNDKLTYDLINEHLNLCSLFCDYPYYETLVGKTTGAAACLPVTLSEYPLNSENDIESYLCILKQIPEYFDNVIKYEDKRISYGMPTPSFILNDTGEELSRFIKDLKNDNNCFVTTFYERTKQTSGLSQKDRSKYISINKYYVNQFIIPAYEKLQNYISHKAKLSAVNNKNIPDMDTAYGLSSFNGGKKYYELIVKSKTGSHRPISELISMIDSKLSDSLSENLNIAVKNTDAYMYYLDHPLETGFHSPEGILEALSLMIRDDYPAIDTPYSYKIKVVPDSLSAMVSPAYYMIPAIDDYENNTIYINPLYTSEENGNIFTTLAHEGFPGHLYQTLYFYNSSPKAIRQILDYPGYVEGWATYVELDSFNYIDYPKYSDCLPTLYRSEAIINLALSSRIDIGVNYENWTLDDTCRYLEKLGFNSYHASELYTYVVEAPGNYLSYFIGYLEIEKLKNEYKNYKMENYTKKEFHKAFLDIGPADFKTVRKYLLGH